MEALHGRDERPQPGATDVDRHRRGDPRRRGLDRHGAPPSFSTNPTSQQSTPPVGMAGWNVVHIPADADLARSSPPTRACSLRPPHEQYDRPPDRPRPRIRRGLPGPRARPGLGRPAGQLPRPAGAPTPRRWGRGHRRRPARRRGGHAATFPPPSPDDLGDDRSARLLRDALRIGFRSSGGPFRCLAGIAVTLVPTNWYRCCWRCARRPFDCSSPTTSASGRPSRPA